MNIRLLLKHKYGDKLPNKLSKLDIVLSVLLALVLVGGIVAALSAQLPLSLVSVSIALGLSAILILKNGNRLGYVSNRVRNVASNLKEISHSIQRLRREQNEGTNQSLIHLKSNGGQASRILTDLEVLRHTNQKQLHSMSMEVLAEIRSSHLSVTDDMKHLSVEMEAIRNDVQGLLGLESTFVSKSKEAEDLVSRSMSRVQENIERRVESEITRGIGVISKANEVVQISQADLLSNVVSRLEELEQSLEIGRSSIVELNRAQTSKLQSYFSTSTEENQKLLSLVSGFDSSEQMRELTGAIVAMQEATKTEISSLSADIRGIDLSDKLVERLTAVTARESLQVKRQLRRHITDTVRDSTRQVEAIAKLIPRLREVNPLIPPTGGFALDAQALLHLIDVLERVRPSLIVEFGGGTSTIWMAYICRKFNTRIISIDHLEEYMERTQREVERHGFSDMIECRLAPLETMSQNGTEYSWYSLAALSDLADVDLLFIDGPPESTGPNARRPAMHVMSSKLRTSATVILDDTHRESEQETVREWISAYPEFELVDDRISRLSVIASK